MAAHRYWRVLCTTTFNGGGNAAVGDIQLRTSAAGANLSTPGSGGTVFSSGDTGGYPADLAFDSSAYSFWYSAATTPRFIGWDFGLGVAYDIGHLTIGNPGDTNVASVLNFSFQWSDDATTWTTYFSGVNPSSNALARASFVYVPPVLGNAFLYNPLIATQVYDPSSAQYVLISPPVSPLSAFGGASANLAAPTAALTFYCGGAALLSAPSPSLASFGGAGLALNAPSPTLSAGGHSSSGESSFSYVAPSPVLAVFGAATAAMVSPSPGLAVTATVTGMGQAALIAPSALVDASGRVSATASSVLAAPMASLIGYSGAVCSITLSGQATLQASGTTGAIGAAAVTCPLFELKASGTVNSLSSASLVAPSPQLSGTANVMYLVAPMATLTAIGTAVVAATFEAYSINLSHRPPRPGDNTAPVDEVTRYTNFPFTQIVRYQNSYFGVAGDGLYLLEGTTDAGVAIPYAVRTCIDDFKVPEKKTAAAAYFGGRLGPDAAITLYAGEQGAESYAFTTPRGQGAQNHREKFGRGVKNRYFAVGVTGEGALELDTLSLETTNLSRKI